MNLDEVNVKRVSWGEFASFLMDNPDARQVTEWSDKEITRCVDELTELSQLAGPLRILDIGCGVGWHAVEFARRGHSVTGVEPIPLLERGQALASQAGVRVRWIKGWFPCEVGDGFDLIYAIHNFALWMSPRAVDAIGAENKVAGETQFYELEYVIAKVAAMKGLLKPGRMLVADGFRSTECLPTRHSPGNHDVKWLYQDDVLINVQTREAITLRTDLADPSVEISAGKVEAIEQAFRAEGLEIESTNPWLAGRRT